MRSLSVGEVFLELEANNQETNRRLWSKSAQSWWGPHRQRCCSSAFCCEKDDGEVTPELAGEHSANISRIGPDLSKRYNVTATFEITLFACLGLEGTGESCWFESVNAFIDEKTFLNKYDLFRPSLKLKWQQNTCQKCTEHFQKYPGEVPRCP